MGYSDWKRAKQQQPKGEQFVFYTPHPHHIVRMSYRVLDGKRVMNTSNHRLANLESTEKSENTSKQSERKTKYAINWLIESAKIKRIYERSTGKNWFFKIGFLTLTFPAMDYNRMLKQYLHQEKQLFTKKGILYVRSYEERLKSAHSKLDALTKECLHNFINTSYSKFQLNNYVWKAETTAAGVVHYHISVDCFAQAKTIQRVWSKIITAKGFTDDFYLQHGHRLPPCTHIKAVKKVKNLAAYIATYMSKKEEGRRVISGRSWGCSEKLQYSKRLVIDCPSAASYAYDKSLSSTNFDWKSIDTIATNLTQSIHIADLFLLKLPSIEAIPEGDLKKDISRFKQHLRHSVQDLFYEIDNPEDYLKTLSPLELTKLNKLQLN